MSPSSGAMAPSAVVGQVPNRRAESIPFKKPTGLPSCNVLEPPKTPVRRSANSNNAGNLEVQCRRRLLLGRQNTPKWTLSDKGAG